MLLKFEVENYKSFRDVAEFSMFKGKQHQHKERIPKLIEYDYSILPVAAVYGANASGKSNFIEALEALRTLVISPATSPNSKLGVVPFALNSTKKNQPTKFTITIRANDNVVYQYSITVDKEKVYSERLSQWSKTSEKGLFNRVDNKIELGSMYAKNAGLMLFAEKILSNSLFLTRAILNGYEEFRPVYNWFNESLKIIHPQSHTSPLLTWKESFNYYEASVEWLKRLDAGIAGIELEVLPPSMQEFIKSKIPSLEKHLAEFDERTAMEIEPGAGLPRITIHKEAGQLVMQVLRTQHLDSDGKIVYFTLNQESNGTQRLIEILPLFTMLNETNGSFSKVLVIDEIESSLHPLVVRKIIENYLGNCSVNDRNQLIFTTHSTELMDQNLFRRDELWLTNRGDSGESEIYSVSEFKDLRLDKDIKKDYLVGRMGGIPHIRFL